MFQAEGAEQTPYLGTALDWACQVRFKKTEEEGAWRTIPVDLHTRVYTEQKPLIDAIATTSSHDLHHMRRKAVETFFSRQSVTRLESRIHDEARSLDEKLRSLKGSGAVVSLDHAFSCMTGDLAAQFACGENPHLLEEPAFNPDWYVVLEQTPLVSIRLYVGIVGKACGEVINLIYRHNALTGILAMVPYVRNMAWINT